MLETIVEQELKPAYNEQWQLLLGCATYHCLFWTFKEFFYGFAYCKPIVKVDGTFLYGNYKGSLLVIVAQDGVSHILQIAFALVEGEIVEA